MDLTATEVDAFEQFVQGITGEVSATRSLEQCANLLCRKLYDDCRQPDTLKASLVLSRLYLSLPYSHLPPDIQSFARRKFSLDPSPKDLFLVLMGTTGREPQWCDRRQSAGHQAIPLNRTTVQSVPMLARCFQQIGFDLEIVLKGETGILLEGIPSSFGVFHVEDALVSPYVPAQEEFVKPYGVHSVIGGGTMLPDGAVSIWIGFTTLFIPADATLPLVRLMPSFWHACHPLYRARCFFD